MLPQVCLSPWYVKASLIWSTASSAMKPRMFLVYTEPSTTRISEAGFEQFRISKCYQFLSGWCNIPSKNIVSFCHGEMLFKTLLLAKNRDKYTCPLKKQNIDFIPVAILERRVMLPPSCVVGISVASRMLRVIRLTSFCRMNTYIMTIWVYIYIFIQ